MLVASALAAGVAVTAALFWVQFAPRHVPPGQAQLVTLGPRSLPVFRTAFGSGEGEVRLLVLLSPT